MQTEYKNKQRELYYFDNNGTTFMHVLTKNQIIMYMDQGNPSGNYDLANRSNNKISHLQNEIIFQLLGSHTKKHSYYCILTSGATESNNTILKQICCNQQGVISSNIEHKSVLQSLASQKNQNHQIIEVDSNGIIEWKHIFPKIQKNTILISIQHANNETGIMNDIQQIGLSLHELNKDRKKQKLNRIFFHSDISQTFGKYQVLLDDFHIDAVSLSMHKLYGPSGVGALVCSNKLIKQIQKKPLICGQQYNQLRGGTENVSLIAGALEALRIYTINRPLKNQRVLSVRNYLIEQIHQILCNINTHTDKTDTFIQYWKDKKTNNIIQSIAKKQKSPCVYGLIITNLKQSMVNTLNISFFAAINQQVDGLCGHIIQDFLQNNNVIVSTGSVCNTGFTSTVLENMKIDKQLRIGTIRISLSDHTLEYEINILCQYLQQTIEQQLANLIKKAKKKHN